MRVLAIDPGATTGWCLYNSESRSVEASGMFRGHDAMILLPLECAAEIVAVERLVPHGASYPQVVEAAYIAGRLVEMSRAKAVVHELTRAVVRSTLQDATHGAVKVKDDTTVRAAVKHLHGGDACTKSGGSLQGVTSHVWAALACAVAWLLRQEQQKETA